MEKQFEAPELTLVGEVEDVVLGFPGMGSDNGNSFPQDFEFEQD